MTNLGPDTVDVTLLPSNPFEKVYIKQLGPLAPGRSTVGAYNVRCEALESDKILLIGAFGSPPHVSGEVNDPNMTNNYVAFVYCAPKFGSS